MNKIPDPLLKVEGERNVFELLDQRTAEALGAPSPDQPLSVAEATRFEYHLTLLADAKFTALSRRSAGYWLVDGISWEGHGLLDSIRYRRIWKVTKAGAELAGGFKVKPLKTLAKGIRRIQVEKHSGLEIDF